MPCRHGDELPLEIERLWRTLAHNRRNIIPMLDFLASLGTHMAYQVGGMQLPDEPSDAPVRQYTPKCICSCAACKSHCSNPWLLNCSDSAAVAPCPFHVLAVTPACSNSCMPCWTTYSL
jgi:hypothetical protein